MATNMLANILITAVISNGFLAAASPVVPAKPQHPTAQRQMSLEVPVADQQERILKFLSLFDEAQKSAIPAADPRIGGIKGMEVMLEVKLTFEGHMVMLHLDKAKLWEEPAYAKTYGKKVETQGVNEGPSDLPFEPSKDLPEVSPLHGKNFWKPSLPASWKIKRVPVLWIYIPVCFWKYCIERK